MFCYFYCNHSVNLIVLKPLLLDSLCSKVSRTFSFARFGLVDLGKLNILKHLNEFFKNRKIEYPIFFSSGPDTQTELGREQTRPNWAGPTGGVLGARGGKKK
jgi:hypothetical protein